MSNRIVEYNTSPLKCGGANIIEAFDSSESIRFNESYVIIGDCLRADEIYAMYDLTIMGDVSADKLCVNGKLYVSGNIMVDEIQCTNGITCGGKIQCKQIVCDADVIATMLDSEEIDIYGSLLAAASVNVENDCKVERNILAGEGFSGAGSLKADNLMVVDYFDFDGESVARVFEMETMYKKICSAATGKNKDDEESEEVESLTEGVKRFYSSFIEKLVENEEEQIIDNLNECAEIEKVSFAELAFLFNEIVRISYLDKIENLMDYLLAIYAKNVFSEQLVAYETLEHVFSQFLEEVELDELEFAVNNIYEFMIALKIVDQFFPEDDEIADRVFSFIGIRYKTVKKQFEGVI